MEVHKRVELTLRGGKLLLWRAGPLKFQKQEMWYRAPVKKGAWAFPYPLFDPTYTDHQTLRHLPKHLEFGEGFELPDTRFITFRGETPKSFIRELEPLEDWESRREWDEETERRLEVVGLRMADGSEHRMDRTVQGYWDTDEVYKAIHEAEAVHWEARQAWVRANGSKVAPRRKFYWEGSLYTHVRSNGTMDNERWELVEVAEVARRFHRWRHYQNFPASDTFRKPHHVSYKPPNKACAWELFLDPCHGRWSGKVA